MAKILSGDDGGNMYLISARDTRYIDKHRKGGSESANKDNPYNGIPFSKNLAYINHSKVRHQKLPPLNGEE